MDKIDINTFKENILSKFDFLIEDYAYVLTESRSNGIKHLTDIVCKLDYFNKNIERNIQIVLIGEDYKTHMFSYVGGMYIMRTSNGKLPDYKSKEDCYTLYNIEEIVQTDSQILKKKLLKDNIFDAIIRGKHFPIFNDESTYGILKPLIQPFGIYSIKEKLKDVLNYGYIIDFDESELPPYEQFFMGAGISYKNKSTGIWVSITFQARDQEFSVSSNSNKISPYGRTCNADYEKLKNEMIEIIKL